MWSPKTPVDWIYNFTFSLKDSKYTVIVCPLEEVYDQLNASEDSCPEDGSHDVMMVSINDYYM